MILSTSIFCVGRNIIENFKDEQAKTVFKKIQADLTDISNLETLQIDNAQIVYLDGFEQLKNLSHLSLSGNLIKNINPVSKLNKLCQQNLSKNQIQYANCLLGLRSLEYLNLSYNHLKYAFCCSFESMRHLDLSHNDIQQLIFNDKCDLLELVDISFNPITQIAIQVGLPSLKKFHANSTLLTNLTPFYKLRNLEVLSISNCIHLKSIEGLFRNTSLGFECILPNLKELTISEEFLNDNSKKLLDQLREGKLKRPFILNKIPINAN